MVSYVQFHQHFTCILFVQKFRAQLFLYLLFRFVLFWLKCAHIMVKLTLNIPKKEKYSFKFLDSYFNFSQNIIAV